MPNTDYEDTLPPTFDEFRSKRLFTDTLKKEEQEIRQAVESARCESEKTLIIPKMDAFIKHLEELRQELVQKIAKNPSDSASISALEDLNDGLKGYLQGVQKYKNEHNQRCNPTR